MPFVKLDCRILDSSIWIEDSDVRIIWITLLAMADANGMVESTAPGIARRASVSLEATRRALGIFEGPDQDSKNPDNEGRRIRRVNGGYLILNYEAYRKKDHTSNERKRRFRERRKAEALRQHDSATSAAVKENKSKRKEIDTLADHVLDVLKIPMGDKGQTETLLRQFGLDEMLAAVNRMKVYFDTVKANKWTEYVIGKHWRNLYEKLEYFSSDENLQNKLRETGRANTGKIGVSTPSDRKRPSETQEEFDRRRDQEITGGTE